MTFREAINSIADGQAAKRPSWLGYVKREDTAAASVTGFTEFASGTTYALGAKVKVTDSSASTVSFYICTTAHTAGTTISTSNFVSVSIPQYTLTFRERAETDEGTGGIGYDGVVSYAFTFSARLDGSSYSYYCSTAPTTSGSTTHTLEVDTLLMDAFLANDWETGITSEIESQRTGGGGRW